MRTVGLVKHSRLTDEERDPRVCSVRNSMEESNWESLCYLEYGPGAINNIRGIRDASLD